MNRIEIEAKITKVSYYQNGIVVQCHENTFGDKITKYTTRINGAAMEEWQKKLAEGNILLFHGNIAEARCGSCGAYIVVYNPVIKDVYRLVPVRVEQAEEQIGTADGMETGSL